MIDGACVMDPENLAVEPPPREGYVAVDGATLYYRESGKGQPIIVLHGGPRLDHHYLLPDMDRLAEEFRLICYDQRGRGKSAMNVESADVSIQSEIEDLERLRAYFHFESVAVLGHSWGGVLAMEYAIRHPERVSYLILLNSAPASHDDNILFQQDRVSKTPDDMELLSELESRSEFVEGDVDARAAYYRVHYRATLREPELLDRLIAHLKAGLTKEGILQAGPIGVRLWNETYETPGYNLLPKLTFLDIPTLVLHGDYDFVPVVCARHIAEAIPGARLVVLRDCGHFSYLERPVEVHQAISDFLRGTAKNSTNYAAGEHSPSNRNRH
jgi:proline iminopeptidase